jgi:hypothetical protein
VAKPSRIFHVVCAYWLTSSDWSSGNAQTEHASTLVSRTRILLGAFPLRVGAPEVIFARVPPCLGLVIEFRRQS